MRQLVREQRLDLGPGQASQRRRGQHDHRFQPPEDQRRSDARRDAEAHARSADARGQRHSRGFQFSVERLEIMRHHPARPPPRQHAAQHQQQGSREPQPGEPWGVRFQPAGGRGARNRQRRGQHDAARRVSGGHGWRQVEERRDRRGAHQRQSRGASVVTRVRRAQYAQQEEQNGGKHDALPQEMNQDPGNQKAHADAPFSRCSSNCRISSSSCRDAGRSSSACSTSCVALPPKTRSTRSRTIWRCARSRCKAGV